MTAEQPDVEALQGEKSRDQCEGLAPFLCGNPSCPANNPKEN